MKIPNFAPLFLLLLGLIAPAQASAPKPLVGSSYPDSFRLNDMRQAGATMTTGANGDSLVVKVPAKAEAPFHIQLSMSNNRALKSGDIVGFGYRVRSLNDGLPAKGSIFVQDAANGYSQVTTKDYEAGSDWKQVLVLAPISEDREPGQIWFNTFLGSQAQDLEFADIRAYNFGPNADMVSAEATLRMGALYFDFEEAFSPVQQPEGTGSIISGNFPAGWIEDSAWDGCEVDIAYSQSDNNPYAGKKHWKINTQVVKQGRAQMLIKPINIDKNYLIKLSLAAKSNMRTSFRIAIGKDGWPFTHYWEQTLGASPEWHKNEYVIPFLESDPTARLILLMDKPGEVEIDEFSLSYVSADALNAGGSWEGNLLTTSSFPAGLAPPWVAESSLGDNYHVAEHELGPTGQPALFLGQGSNPYFSHYTRISSPFVGKQGAEHTFSFYAKSDTPGQHIDIRMGPPEKNLWEAPFSKGIALSNDWQRYSFTLKLPYTSSGYYIARINSHAAGEIHVDGFQVEVGDKATTFKRSGAVELALAPGKINGLFFEGEALRFNATGWGELPAEKLPLKVVVTDVYDREIEVGTFNANVDGKQATASLELPLAKDAALGSYRVEVTAVDAAGEAISKTAELMLARVRNPKAMGRFADDSPFGIHTVANHAQARLAKDLGFNWVRAFHAQWSGMERVPGEWDFSTCDAMVNAAHDNKLRSLLVAGTAPRWASTVPDSYKRWDAGGFVIKDWAAWQNYCRKLTERYMDRVKHYELWNEPFLGGFFGQGVDEQGNKVRGTAEQLMRIVSEGAEAIKSVDPEALVMWNSGAHYDLEWEKSVIALGMFEHVDIVSYHHYLNTVLGYPTDELSRAINMLDDITPAAHKDMEIWNTEGGSGGSLQGPYKHIPPLDRREQGHYWADFVVRYFVSSLSKGCDKFFLYTYHHFGEFKPMYDWLNQDGSIAFNCVSFSNMAWHLEGKEYVGHIELAETLHTFVFADAQESVAVVMGYGLDQLELSKAPAGIKAVDLYGNPLSYPATVGSRSTFFTGPVGTDWEGTLKKLLKQR